MIAPPAWARPTLPLDDVEVLAATVAMEASDQPWLGKLGVAWAIVNRCDQQHRSIPDICLAPQQFSAWNSDSPTRQWLDTVAAPVWWQCRAAAAAAYFRLVDDPTGGATFYLNPELTKRIRGGVLPAWAAKPGDPSQLDEGRVTLRVADQVWLRKGTA